MLEDQRLSLSEDWLRRVFVALSASRANDFSGVGLILYYPPAAVLPVLPLAGDNAPVPLPTANLNGSIELLLSTSRFSSLFHDGFHLVDATTLNITHVSQYFAPPIPELLPPIIVGHPIGARFMSAWLGSLLPTVQMTAILSNFNSGLFFRRGTAQPLAI